MHTVIIVGLFWQQLEVAEENKANELQFGSSGGGGGEGEHDHIIQFGQQSDPQEGITGLENITRFTLLDIKVYSDEIKAQLVPVKEVPKQPVTKKGKKQQRKIIIAENLPTRWVRRGSGPEQVAVRAAGMAAVSDVEPVILSIGVEQADAGF